jgi:hypothetical protein
VVTIHDLFAIRPSAVKLSWICLADIQIV